MKADDLLTAHGTDNGMEIRLPATVPPYKMRQQYYRYELQSDTDIQALAAEINEDALSDPADPVRLTGTVQYLEAHTPRRTR
jgi:hypothetical protein